MAGSQDTVPDPRNESVVIWLNGALVARPEAKVSVFDAGFAFGDGVWEGLRLHRGALLFLDAHLDRLFAGARAIGLEIGMDRGQITAALAATLAANQMTDGAHIRLMATRGLKATVSQDPRNALGPPTIVIVAEFKTPPRERALRLATVSVRCTPREMFDMRINSHSRLSLITALLEAIAAGADEALMLDPNGFVSSCNATNFFMVRRGEVITSRGDFCFHGVTRDAVIRICRDGGIPLRLADFTPDEAREANEAFVTGTLGGVTPVAAIDGRPLTVPGPVTRRLADLYEARKDADAAAHPLTP